MTIGIEILRADKGGNLDSVYKSEEMRGRGRDLVDEVIKLDNEWIKAQYNTEQARKAVNAVQKVITEKKKTSKGQDMCEAELKQKDEKEAEVKKCEEVSDELKAKRDAKLGKIGNIIPPPEVDPDIVVNKSEDHNKVVKEWGKTRDFSAFKYGSTGFRPHFELLEMLGAVEFEAGRDVVGERGYFLMGPGVLLNMALLNYGIAFLAAKGYTPVQPPYMMRKDLMGKTAELADYDETLYKVVEDPEKPELDKYLIATSEQPISAMHHNQPLDQKDFPIKYTGISSCFRREAGGGGRDIRGIFRVHQFEKVEQFVFCAPDKSWEEHNRMIDMACEFWQSLGIPYQVISIVTGALNNAAAKKYDLEGWFPGDDEGKGKYRELVSCSNCLDYQARAMNTKYGFKPEDPFCHMLNSTLCATTRGLCTIVENYQEEKGVRVPRVLVPFMLGQEFLPFVKELKTDKKEAAAKPAAKQDAKGKKK